MTTCRIFAHVMVHVCCLACALDAEISCNSDSEDLAKTWVTSSVEHSSLGSVVAFGLDPYLANNFYDSRMTRKKLL